MTPMISVALATPCAVPPTAGSGVAPSPTVSFGPTFVNRWPEPSVPLMAVYDADSVALAQDCVISGASNRAFPRPCVPRRAAVMG